MKWCLVIGAYLLLFALEIKLLVLAKSRQETIFIPLVVFVTIYFLAKRETIEGRYKVMEYMVLYLFIALVTTGIIYGFKLLIK